MHLLTCLPIFAPPPPVYSPPSSPQVRYPSKMSEECRTFVTWCLQHNPTDRPGVKELLEHKWITLHQVRQAQALQGH